MTDFTLEVGPQVKVIGDGGNALLSPIQSVDLKTTAVDAGGSPTGSATYDSGVLVITLGIPAGDPGAAGAAPTLKFGAVQSGSEPSATLVDNKDGSYTLNLTLVNGTDATAPTFAAGSVTAGDAPAATLNKDASGNYTLDLTLVNGKDAVVPTFAAGTVVSGDKAAAELVKGSDGNYSLNLTVVDGKDATVPSFAAGTVTSGSTASAELVKGSDGNYTLNLTTVNGKDGVSPVLSMGQVSVADSAADATANLDTTTKPGTAILNIKLPPAEAPVAPTATANTGAYTLKAADAGNILVSNDSTAVTYTVPADLVAGDVFTVVQGADGVITFTPAEGTTINNVISGSSTNGKYSLVTLTVINPQWVILSGDVATPSK